MKLSVKRSYLISQFLEFKIDSEDLMDSNKQWIRIRRFDKYAKFDKPTSLLRILNRFRRFDRFDKDDLVSYDKAMIDLIKTIL